MESVLVDDLERVWEELEDSPLFLSSEDAEQLTEEQQLKAGQIFANLKGNRKRFGNPPDDVIRAGTCTANRSVCILRLYSWCRHQLISTRCTALKNVDYHGGKARGLLEQFRKIHRGRHHV